VLRNRTLQIDVYLLTCACFVKQIRKSSVSRPLTYLHSWWHHRSGCCYSHVIMS